MGVSHKGAISLGLLYIPVGLYTTTRDNDIRFNQLCKDTKERVRYKKYCPSCNKEVKSDGTIKGYEYEPDKYVVMTQDEIEKIKSETSVGGLFKRVASSSDEFLEAIRKDRAHLRSILTNEAKEDLIAHNASSGVQDAIEGLFSKTRLRWGHGERYYNRKYAAIESMDRQLRTTGKKQLQEVYKGLGFDASNQAKVKTLCRQYEAASEIWAHVMSAEVCGGEALKYVKEYLPNSYEKIIEILKGVK